MFQKKIENFFSCVLLFLSFNYAFADNNSSDTTTELSSDEIKTDSTDDNSITAYSKTDTESDSSAHEIVIVVEEDGAVAENTGPPEESTICSFVKRAFDGLGTPRGATVITCIFGVTQGISNFAWAFDWTRYTNFSDDTAAFIQEMGGLTASAECFILGALVPVMLYKYNQHQ